MNRRYLHHLWTRIRPIKTWYLLAIFLVAALVCATALRNNYQTMVRLRTAVYAADDRTDAHDGKVEEALQSLRAFVGQHMNTNLATSDGVYPPIQLVHTYKLLNDAEQARVNAINSQVYTDAQHTCEALYPGSFSGGPRVPCIEAYVKAHGTSPQKIPADVYKFDFASPRWSPDLAGWSLVISVVLLTLAAIRFIIGRFAT